MKHIKSKKNRGLVTKSIAYKNKKHSHDQSRELKVNVPRGEIIDPSYAAAMVAMRTSIPLEDVHIIKIVGVND